MFSAAASLPDPEVDFTVLITLATTVSIAATEPFTATSIFAAATSASLAAASRLASNCGFIFFPWAKLPSKAPADNMTPDAVAANALAAPSASSGAVIAALREFAEA